MQLVAQQRSLPETFVRHVNWRGRSGRLYALTPVRLDDFGLDDNALHLIALGHQVLWAGSADDLIHDAASRARFRLALDCADRAFVLPGYAHGLERLTMVWDLEGAEPLAGLSAA